LTRSIRSTYLIKLELLLNSKIRIKQINSIKLKLNLTITLVFDIIFILFYSCAQLQLVILFKLSRLIVELGFGSKCWNRPDPSVPTLGIDSKPDLVRANLESIRLDPTRFSVPILGIESNRQEIENYVIMPRITNFRIKCLLIKCIICIYRLYKPYRCNLLM